MNGFLPLVLALVLVETGWRIAAPAPAPAWPALAGALALWLGLCEAAVRLLAARPSPARARRWDLAAQGLLLAAFAWLCLGQGWPRQAGGYALALLPWVAGLAVHWWTSAHLSGGRWSRAGHLLHQVRWTLLPVAVALPMVDLCAWFGRATGLERWSAATFGPAAVLLGSLAVAAGVVALLPAVLVRLWRARPPADPALRGSLEDAVAAAGVRVAGVLVWPEPGGRAHNALLIGVLPRLRYVLLTAGLVEDFGERERLAVLGHELGHARHRHLWLYLLFATVAGLASWLVAGPVAAALGGLGLAPALVEGGVALALLALCWRLAFGVVSRLCERQADLAGAVLAGGPAAMRAALLAVARCAGHEPDAPNWRHHSIRERVRWLDLVEADPAEAGRHHRRVAAAWWCLAGMLAGLVMTLVAQGALRWETG